MLVPPSPRSLGRDTRVRGAARAALARVLWDAEGRRRLPSEPALVRAIEACDRRDLWWVCETAQPGPVYLLPTRRWIGLLARWLDSTGARRVLEVGAGDGFLSACLARARPRLEVVATDSGAWARPGARMSARDRREFAGVPVAGIRAGGNVRRMGAVEAVRRFRPDVTIVCWPPPGRLVERVIRAPSRLVLEIAVEGDVCGDFAATWRWRKRFLDGPLEDRALCRLDARPREARHTRVTLYYGAAHPEHGRER